MLLLTALPAVAQVAAQADVAMGRRIYLEGVLPDGQPLHGVRADVGVVTGAAAACVACHRPSGLGQVEGNIGIPPISGKALFGSADPVVVRMDRRFDPGLSVPHAPYDDASFAAALRSGQHVSGRAMHALMPRYTLSDAQARAVAAYLKTLSPAMSPAVVGDTIHMATVIAPGVDPVRRQAFIQTLTTAVKQMNLNVMSAKRQKMIAVEERRLHSRRKWELDIWELSGASESWAEQLEQHQREKPVLALVSGLANSEWKPVQDFCEAKHVACWFPSVDVVPAGAAGSQFSLYFSAGIAVEAQVIASKLKADRARVVQLVANDPVARAGAAALRQALAANQGGGEQHAVLEVDASAGIAALTASLSGLGARDSVVLWLRQADLQGMVNLPQTTAQVFVSATLAGDERLELPVALRQHARLVQPLEVPHLREANLERLQSWLEGSRLPVVDLRMQSEIYFAAGSLQSTLRGMLNNLHADYLIERAEATLSGFEAIQVQEEIQAMMMGPMNKLPLSQAAATPSQVAAVAATSKAQRDHLEEMRMRGGTTVYPRLGLAQGQRFASKGAYLEPLNPNAPGVLGEPEWVVP
jgi:cytochrome c553